MATDAQSLRNLEDGVYLYLVTAENTLIYSNRTPDLSASVRSRHLATHLSLYERLRELGDANPQIVAGGEFHRVHGRTSQINNKAGTFRDRDGDRLDFAILELRERGLPVEAKTEIRNYGTQQFADLHAEERQLSQLLLQYYHSEEFFLVRALFRDLSEKFPDPNIAGHFDKNEIINRFRVSMNPVKRQTTTVASVESGSFQFRDAERLLYMGLIIISMHQNEGMAFVTDRLVKRLRQIPGYTFKECICLFREVLLQ